MRIKCGEKWKIKNKINRDLDKQVKLCQGREEITKHKWDKVFKNAPSKLCGRQPLENSTWSTLEYFFPDIVHLKKESHCSDNATTIVFQF